MAGLSDWWSLSSAEAALQHTWQQYGKPLLLAACAWLDTQAGPCKGSADSNKAPEGWVAGHGFVLAGCVALLTVAVSVLLYSSSRWHKARHGSTLVAVAAASAADLRRSRPDLFPPAAHSWYHIDLRDLPAPTLNCAHCCQGISRGTFSQTVRCCEVCGALAHAVCSHSVAHDCRPVAMEAPRMVHLWRAAGTALPLPEEGDAAAVAVCVYCREPCQPEAFATEPQWSCITCGGAAHVRCYHDYHVPATSAASAAGDTGAASTEKAAGAPAAGAPGGPDRGSPTAASTAAVAGRPLPQASTRATQPGTSAAAGADAGEPHHGPGSSLRHRQHQRRPSLELRSASEAPLSGQRAPELGSHPLAPSTSIGPHGTLRGSGARLGHRRTGSFGSVMTALQSMLSGTEGQPGGGVSGKRSRRPSRVDVDRLDECPIGPHRRLVLPPIAVRALPGTSWAERARSLRDGASSLLHRRARNKPASKGSMSDTQGGSTGGAGGDVGGGGGSAVLSLVARVSSSALGGLSDAGSSMAGGARRRRGWWRAGSVPELRWEDFRLGQLPPGCRPVLACVSTKSGPMLGPTWRRILLRLLNPLQVVELPRQKPDAALTLIADAPGARVLAVGGDGTVGWLLSALDRLGAEKAAARQDDWRPPPVGVLPLGTGNDLARCLNWGGGAVDVQARGGLRAALQDVENAAVTLLDRWDIRIRDAPRPSRRRETGLEAQLRRMGSLASPRRARDATGPSNETAADGDCKVMNNYLGIGVDAKVALDFHAIRGQFPHWFQSQMGNKLWYTGFGAKDILAGESRGLTQKLTLECDGRPVALPGDIEGLLVLNICSYMGGVDLWASGDSGSPAGGAEDGEEAFLPQSFNDGVLEVVGVYGSWHLGQLQVGLSRAVRICQCRSARVATAAPLAMQVDGEPWMQSPATLEVTLRGQAHMLRRVGSPALARVAAGVAEALAACQERGVISAQQRHALTAELAARLQPLL